MSRALRLLLLPPGTRTHLSDQPFLRGSRLLVAAPSCISEGNEMSEYPEALCTCGADGDLYRDWCLKSCGREADGGTRD